MKFQPTSGTYAAVDPFKPSIAFSVARILGSQKAPRDNTDLHSPPPRRATVHSPQQLDAAQPSTNIAVDPKFEEPGDFYIPTGLPPHEIRVPGFAPPLNNRIPGQLPPGWFQPVSKPSDSPIQVPPHDFPHRLSESRIIDIDWERANSRRNTSPPQNLNFQSRRHSRSQSPPNRWRRRPPTPPLMRSSPPQASASRVNEQLHSSERMNQPPTTSHLTMPYAPSPSQYPYFRSGYRSRSSSSGRSRERSRSPRRRRSRSRSRRSRSRSPIQLRGSRSRSTRRSTSTSTRSDDRPAPVVISESPSRRRSVTPPTELQPTTIALPPFEVPELPAPSSTASSIVTQPSSSRSSFSSRSSRSRIPPIIPHRSPTLIPIEALDSSMAGNERPSHATDHLSSIRNLASLWGSGSPTPYPPVIPQDVRNPIVIQPPLHDIYGSAARPLSLITEKTEPSVSVSSRSRRSAVSFLSETSDERRPVPMVPMLTSIQRLHSPRPLSLLSKESSSEADDEEWPAVSSESVHLPTYVAAFVLDTLPRQLYLYFLLRLPYMYFSRVTRIFEEAEMTMPQIKEGILAAAIQLNEPVKHVADAWKLEPVESVQYSKLQNTWQSFIDSLMREWKTLNIISVLLLS